MLVSYCVARLDFLRSLDHLVEVGGEGKARGCLVGIPRRRLGAAMVGT
jgi:hypothetical protein